MDGKREQAFVGLFVIIAVALLLVTIFSLTGFFSRAQPTFHARFAFAGGLEPGAEVRYSGGPKDGRVTAVAIDPNDPSLIDVTFSVDPKVPVKTDSHVKIQSLSPLGDNHLEIVPGHRGRSTCQTRVLSHRRSIYRFQRVDGQAERSRAGRPATDQPLNERVDRTEDDHQSRQRSAQRSKPRQRLRLARPGERTAHRQSRQNQIDNRQPECGQREDRRHCSTT